MAAETKDLYDFILARHDNDNICKILNEYFARDEIFELMTSDEKREKFIDNVSRLHNHLKWFLARVSPIEEEKKSKKRNRIEKENNNI
ncbi:hypothetical protein Indivirus_1_104 [Indivirus ILV1]|uniref:Uncharacterized protein n=1 Tax=Indivirus ILV1 TaxID=1977633 RepID=A0A1V0SCR2_9VIRU|nr:hypothetical protein Indivirus_1_104 [Indivirus ILV1]